MNKQNVINTLKSHNFSSEKIDDFLEYAPKQKKAFSSFEINVPDADKEFVLENMCTRSEALTFDLIFSKHTNISEIRPIYDLLKNNFECELGDVITTKDPYCVYLISTNTLKEGMQSTGIYKYVGFVSCDRFSINFLWIHPYLRGKGIMSNFLIGYAINESILSIQPPITKAMKRCMDKVESIHKNNPEINNAQFKFRKKFLKHICPKFDFSNFSPQEVASVMEGVMSVEALNLQNGKEASHEMENMVDVLGKSIEFFRANPKAFAELKEELKDVDTSYIDKARADLISGRSIRPYG